MADKPLLMLCLPFEAGSDSCGVMLRFVRSNESVPEGYLGLKRRQHERETRR